MLQGRMELRDGIGSWETINIFCSLYMFGLGLEGYLDG
jgi:hypothetical protein